MLNLYQRFFYISVEPTNSPDCPHGTVGVSWKHCALDGD